VSAPQETARAVLDRYGTTYAGEAGIRLANGPGPLFQLLVRAQLLAARIGADIAVTTAGELFARGWTTPQRMRDAARASLIQALGRGGYRRYDERTATQLRDMSQLVVGRYGGDLRGLAQQADGDVGSAGRLLQEVKGIGPTDASVFSSGRCRPSGRGCARTWTTEPAPGPGGSASPTTATTSPHSCPTATSPASRRGWCASHCCPPARNRWRTGSPRL
jgi:endonuclease III